MSQKTALFGCDNPRCSNETSDPRRDGWITSSGETIVGGRLLHDHRSMAGHYCSWHCFAPSIPDAEVRDL